ncbi:hypothetical protein FHS43_006878 [Streptosporangium becharense]|uniref:Uncharacterized protein n=1 Tax=Streptosporangium becharense TaxID=1816182 RepID=A0A7W9IF11_9ACTN|nr:hypothetical protein [Streptosporangium becharense]MBB2915555.1 hypothetical protein [Streptosporangium becharense]MBB5818918.1 hypothetical protein [Streptosporangium becharense]
MALGDQGIVLGQHEQLAEHGQLGGQLFQIPQESFDALKAECGDIGGASMRGVGQHPHELHGLGTQHADIGLINHGLVTAAALRQKVQRGITHSDSPSKSACSLYEPACSP